MPFIPSSENDGVIAEASSYYAYPLSFSNTGGIIDNLVWKTINSGVDAYFDVASVVLSTDPSFITIEPGYYHGEIHVNFLDEDDDITTNNDDPVHWNLDYASAPGLEEYDLYSVLLHEICHALGFASNINLDGTGYGGTHYTRFDRFLKTADVPHPEGNLPLIYTEGETCSMYWHNWNPAISTERLHPYNPATDFDPSSVGPPSTCNTSEDPDDFFITNCYNAMRFVGSIDVPVFTPLCFRLGSSLSHLEDQCVSGVPEYEYYLMAAVFPEGVMRRYPQPDERSILCDLGYHLNDRFGFASNNVDDDGTFENDMVYSSVCGGSQIVGINDGIADNGQYLLFTAAYTENLTLSGSQLLSNDVIGDFDISTLSGVTFECLESVVGNANFTIDGDNSEISGDFTSGIVFTSGGNPGLKLFRYVPKYGNIYGNITYVFIFFQGDSGGNSSYYGNDECNFSGCILLNNGNFEEDSEWCSHTIMQGTPAALTCWTGMGASLAKPIYFSSNLQIGTDHCLIGVTTNTNTLMTNTPEIGIGSNTGTMPPTDAPYQGSNGIVLMTARHSTNTVGGSFGFRSSKLNAVLGESLVQGQQYKLSYRAKVYDASFDALNCQLCNTNPSAPPLYENTNLPAFPRFLISNIGFSFGAGNTDIPVNTVDWEDSIENLDGIDNVVDLASWSTNPPMTIEPIGDSPTASSDWHYREFVFTVPLSSSSDYQYLIVDYDIWQANYENTAVGYFLDDVTLQPYYGEVVSLPDEICEGAQIGDLLSYSNYPTFEGVFSCPICPEGTLGVNNNSFDSNVSGVGEFQVIFTYENSQGCEGTDIQSILVKPIADCCEIQWGSQYTMTDCDPSLTIISTSPQTYINNVNMQMTSDQYTYQWQSDVEFEPIGPSNNVFQAIQASDCGVFNLTLFDPVNGCFDSFSIETICPNGPMQVSYVVDHGQCDVMDTHIDVSVADGSGEFIYNWYFGTGNIVIATSEDFSPAITGVYRFTVQDVHCSDSYDSGLIMIQSDQVDVVIDINQECQEDAEICVNVVNGVSPFSYVINGVSDTDGCFTGVTDEYHILVTDDLGCTYETTSFIQTGAGIAPEIILPNSCAYTVGEIIQFANDSNEPDLNYLWTFGDGGTSEIQNPQHVFTQSGVYEVELLLTTSGCSEMANVEVTIVDVVESFPVFIGTQVDADLYANLWNDQFVLITEDIEFGASDGSVPIEVQFENVVFVLADGVDIIVNESAELFFDHCQFTSCRNWNGFDLRSDGSTAELPAALVLNNCLIEYALVGIYTSDISHESEVREAGIYHIEDCDFINNLVSIRVESANAPNYELSYEQRNGSFYSRFKLNDEFEGRFDEPFRSMVDYYYTKSYHFFSCEFENGISNVEEWSDRGVAIHGFNASFYIDDEDTENADAELSRFKGFDMAIELSVTDGTYNHPIIRETDFAQNRIAIYNLNVCFQRIIKNDIIVGEPTGIAALDEEEIDHEGMVLDGGGFYRVSSNEIIGDALSTSNTGATIGIRIRDNVTQSQKVNNNEVHNCHYAMLANGNNRINDSGLRYVCNQMSDNGTDIFVGEFPSSGFAADISKWQSDLGSNSFGLTDEKAAGNTFTANPDDQNFFNNAGGSNISYLLYTQGANQTPICVGNILLNINGQENVCVLEAMDQYPTADSILLDDINSAINFYKGQNLNYQYLYHAIIDNGNTQAMLELVDNSWTADIWQTRAALLNGSPYLSDETLRKVADATPAFPHLVALEIFLANPTVTTQQSFLLYLKSNTDMPDEMIDLIEGNTSQAVLRSELEENLEKSHMHLIDAVALKIHYSMDNDSLNMYHYIDDVLNAETILGDWLAIDALVSQKMFVEAEEILNLTMGRIYFSKEDIRDESESMAIWLNLITNNRYLETLASEDIETLHLLCEDYYFTSAGKRAAAALNEYYQEIHFIPAYYSGSNSMPRFYAIDNSAIEEVHLFTVYPNPANNHLQVFTNYSLISKTSVEFQILDNAGRIVFTLIAGEGSPNLLLDTTNLGQGQYYLCMNVDGRTLDTQIFQIQH